MWTESDINILKENHGKLTLSQISKLLSENKKYSCIRGQVQRLGLFRHKKDGIKLPNKNTYNMHYWDVLTPINCYLAGLISGDGCLFLSKRSKTMTFVYPHLFK